jgi:hypothetical protein
MSFSFDSDSNLNFNVFHLFWIFEKLFQSYEMELIRLSIFFLNVSNNPIAPLETILKTSKERSMIKTLINKSLGYPIAY